MSIIKAGTRIPSYPNDPKPTIVPRDFLKTEVESREVVGQTQYRTGGETGILTKMMKYKPHDSFAMLYITNKDLYPGPDWSYCFGWSNPL